MSLVLWLLLALFPVLLGNGVLELLDGKREELRRPLADVYPAGLIVCIGIAGTAHLTAVFLQWSFSDFVKLFGGLAGALGLAAVLLLTAKRRRRAGGPDKRRERARLRVRKRLAGPEPLTGTQQLLLIAFGISVLLQLVLVLTGEQVYRTGDMTVETVNSFQATDGIYQVNPLTGQAYTAGIPLRLKILALPSLYGALSSIFHLPAAEVVEKVIPAVFLAAAYFAYASLAGALFEKDRTGRSLFLLLVSLLLWAGDYAVFMDGFGLLHCGYRGTALRAGVLLPYCLSLCLREKWKTAVLCILAEACIVWTLYGMGLCLALAVSVLLIQILYRRFAGRRGGAAWSL